MQDEAIRTLRYWLDVEALTAPDAEERDDEGENHYVRHVYPGNRLPWQEPRLLLEGRPRRHIVRFGIIPSAAYEAELLAFLNTEKTEDNDSGRGPHPKSFTFLGFFEADDQGRALPGTLKLAVFAHAFASLAEPDVPSFGDYQGRVATKFEAMLSDAQAEGGDGGMASQEFIATLVAEATSVLCWTPKGMAGAPLAIVRCEAAVNEKGRPRTVQPAPINSFHYDAIESALAAVSAGEASGLVLPYLAEPDDQLRADCLDLEVISRTLSLECMPDGRWPSAHDLTLMQQVAVNQALMSCQEEGIFSINGPPGTGKTTLLMDIVAAVVVERAKVLARFADPKRAFKKLCTLQFPGKATPANINALDKRLHGFGIVVASSNNGAVENVTREFPNAGKIDAKYLDEAAHFIPTAQALLKVKPQDPADDEDDEEDANVDSAASANAETDGASKPVAKPTAAWGLVSAALGKKKNRTAFIQTLKAMNGEAPEPSNVFHQLKEMAKTVNWGRSRATFEAALAEVKRLKREIADIEELEASAEAARAAEAEARSRLDGAARTLADAERQEATLRQEIEERSREFRRADDGAKLLAAKRPARPFLWLADLPVYIAPMRETRAWLRDLEAVIAKRTVCETKLEQAEADLKACSKLLAAAADQHRQATEEAERQVAERQKALDRCEEAAARHPGLVTFAQFRALDPKERQHLLPRSSVPLRDARARLFLDAMALHRAFIAAAGAPYEQNLKRALDMLSGDAIMGSVLPKAADDLWASLFLLVPVMSSTFASFLRSFGSMPSGSIGWLVVDEAGQAVPQHAVGALLKARRALVVGDPYQVEPVITLDPNIDAELLERHGTPQRLRSTGVSLQVVADQINPFGTYMKNYQGELDWVGSPLKVHRRCAEPMFSIANEIAYNSTMVLGRGKAEGEAAATLRRPLLGDSRWIDVEGTEGNRKHFIPAQADIAFGIIRAFMAQGWVKEDADDGLPDLYVISPFKSAADGMRDLMRRRREQWAPGIKAKAVKPWLKKSVGTVHTFQGKEAETVVFVLGGATDGAIEWAAKTPNILNVAATRAQRRFYVVGDWSRWMEWPLAQIMGASERLPRVSTDETLALIQRLSGGQEEQGEIADRAVEVA